MYVYKVVSIFFSVYECGGGTMWHTDHDKICKYNTEPYNTMEHGIPHKQYPNNQDIFPHKFYCPSRRTSRGTGKDHVRGLRSCINTRHVWQKFSCPRCSRERILLANFVGLPDLRYFPKLLRKLQENVQYFRNFHLDRRRLRES